MAEIVDPYLRPPPSQTPRPDALAAELALEARELAEFTTKLPAPDPYPIPAPPPRARWLPWPKE